MELEVTGTHRAEHRLGDCGWKEKATERQGEQTPGAGRFPVVCEGPIVKQDPSDFRSTD